MTTLKLTGEEFYRRLLKEVDALNDYGISAKHYRRKFLAAARRAAGLPDGEVG